MREEMDTVSSYTMQSDAKYNCIYLYLSNMYQEWILYI